MVRSFNFFKHLRKFRNFWNLDVFVTGDLFTIIIVVFLGHFTFSRFPVETIHHTSYTFTSSEVTTITRITTSVCNLVFPSYSGYIDLQVLVENVSSLEFPWELFWCDNYVVYYESIKRELKTELTYECRCDERLKTTVEESTRLADTRLHDKTN